MIDHLTVTVMGLNDRAYVIDGAFIGSCNILEKDIRHCQGRVMYTCNPSPGEVRQEDQLKTCSLSFDI